MWISDNTCPPTGRKLRSVDYKKIARREGRVRNSKQHKKMEDGIFKVYLYCEDNFYSHCIKKISYHCLQTPPGNIDQHLILLSLSLTLVAFS